MWIKKKEWKKLQEKIEKIKEQQQIDKEVFDFLLNCLETKENAPISFSYKKTWEKFCIVSYLEIKYIYENKVRTITVCLDKDELPTLIENTSKRFVFKYQKNKYYIVDKEQGVCCEIPNINIEQ